MNELQVFTYQTSEVRTLMKDGEPWWVLKDVCTALGLSNPSIVAERLDGDERAKLSLGRQGETNIINESGLYNVILRSDKPESKAFKRWITHDVLPSIRKTGKYTVLKESAPRSKPVDIIFRQRLNMAKDFSRVTGMPLGIAVTKAITDAEKLTGEDYDYWKRSLPERQDDKAIPNLSTTQLGATIGLSAQDVNIKLEKAGLQVKPGKKWRLTEAGKQHGEEYPFERNGHSDYYIRWRESGAEAVKVVL